MANELGLGRFQYCLQVEDVEKSETFYLTLGFHVSGGDKAEGFVILRNEDCELGLFKRFTDKNCMNFRGGNVKDIVTALKEKGMSFDPVAFNEDGSGSAFLADPDGNVIFFDSMPDEISNYKKERPLLQGLDTLKSV